MSLAERERALEHHNVRLPARPRIWPIRACTSARTRPIISLSRPTARSWIGARTEEIRARGSVPRNISGICVIRTASYSSTDMLRNVERPLRNYRASGSRRALISSAILAITTDTFRRNPFVSSLSYSVRSWCPYVTVCVFACKNAPIYTRRNGFLHKNLVRIRS